MFPEGFWQSHRRAEREITIYHLNRKWGALKWAVMCHGYGFVIAIQILHEFSFVTAVSQDESRCIDQDTKNGGGGARVLHHVIWSFGVY